MVSYILSRNTKMNSFVHPYEGYQKIVHVRNSAYNLYLFSSSKKMFERQLLNLEDEFIFYHGTGGYKGLPLQQCKHVLLDDLKNGQFEHRDLIGFVTLIYFVKGRLFIRTDSNGLNFCYAEQFFDTFSSSITLFPLMRRNLTLCKQSALEYLFASQIFGQCTFFEEVKKLDARKLYEIRDTSCQGVSYDFSNFKKDFSFLKSLSFLHDVEIGVDLSGGMDTRTLLALLNNIGVSYQLLSNKRAKEVSDDVFIVERLSENLGKDVEWVELERNFLGLEVTHEIAHFFYDASRGLDISLRGVNEVLNKRKSDRLNLGGWGAELLRIASQQRKTFESTLKHKLKKIPISEDRKHSVIQDSLKRLSLSNKVQEGGEQLEFHMQQKNWIASLFTARNNNGNWFFPFMLDSFVYDISKMPKRNRQNQSSVIRNWDPNVLTVETGGKATYIKRVKHKALAILNIGWLNRHFVKPAYEYNSKISDNHLLNEKLGFNRDDLRMLGAIDVIPRYDQLLFLLRNRII